MIAAITTYFTQPFPAPMTFFLIGAAAFIVGHLFHKCRLPDVAGQVLLGILIGPAAFELFSAKELHDIAFLSDIALGFMTFSVGGYLNFKVLHNSGSRILKLALFDCVFVFTLVFAALYYLIELPLEICLLLAAIAIETSPGAVVALIQKKYARGVFTKTLIGVVALNNLFTIVIFEIVKAVDLGLLANAGLLSELKSVGFVFISLIYGIGIGWLAAFFTRKLHESSDLFAVIVFILIGNVMITTSLGLSPMLSNLAIGAVFCNFSYHTDRIINILNTMHGLIFALFFALAGTHLGLDQLKLAGVAGICVVVVRIIAKFGAVKAACSLFNYPSVISRYLGLALLSQAGLTIGLVISLSETPALSVFIPTLTAIILTAVAANELIGSVTTAKAFDMSEESGQAIPRLIDFLHEEYILLPLEAEDKWEAIEKMSEFLVKTNRLKSMSKDDLLETIMNREKEFTTGLGNRLAIPHGRIPRKENLMGVIGICKKPIDWESVDAQPVDIVIMIATPEGQEALHLKVLSAVGQIFAEDNTFHNKMVSATSETELYDLMQSKDIRDINTYITDL